MSFVSNLWKTTKSRLGFYGALAAIGGGALIVGQVYQVLTSVKYKEGPLGRKTHVKLSEPFVQGSTQTEYTVGSFLRTLENMSSWDQLSEDRKTYIRRAVLNYENGYTFTNGDGLLSAILDCWFYGTEKAITWPIPEED